jgi:ribosomal protein L3 glutamine methyltransferase
MSLPLTQGSSVLECIQAGAQQLSDAGVAFGHGTSNAFDEAAWLVLWQLGLPLHDLDSVKNRPLALSELESIATLLRARIETRKPAAYLTKEAWLQGVAFYVDERSIVPRSLIAELLVQPDFAHALDSWLSPDTRDVLDLCTGNGSLAVLAAMVFPDVHVDASDLSPDALAVAAINVARHGLQSRITLMASDGLASVGGPYDLMVCNPPYVNAQSMAQLPPEYLTEPAMALDGNRAGGRDGMDFIRQLMQQAYAKLTPQGVVVLEVGHERDHFEAAFPELEVVWLQTSAGDDQVLLIPREALPR